MGTRCRSHVPAFTQREFPSLCFQRGPFCKHKDKALLQGTPMHMHCGYCASAKRNIIYLNSTCFHFFACCALTPPKASRQGGIELIHFVILKWGLFSLSLIYVVLQLLNARFRAVKIGQNNVWIFLSQITYIWIVGISISVHYLHDTVSCGRSATWLFELNVCRTNLFCLLLSLALKGP